MRAASLLVIGVLIAWFLLLMCFTSVLLRSKDEAHDADLKHFIVETIPNRFFNFLSNTMAALKASLNLTNHHQTTLSLVLAILVS